MRVLGIESSCDETAVALVEVPMAPNGPQTGRAGQDSAREASPPPGVALPRILSEHTASQIAIHAPFGGVVPEIASRHHLQALPALVEAVLASSPAPSSPVDAVAVTAAPGLLGALLTGVSYAKGLAMGWGVPLVGVHHIEAHLHAVFLTEFPPTYPFLGLVVSGGHSHLYAVDGVGRLRTLGRTLDDAAGEAFDKTAKLLGLPYPGGPAIDRLAAQGHPNAFDLPRGMIHDARLDMSFSGLKTAVRRLVESERQRLGSLSPTFVADMAASFQQAVVDTLVSKARQALRATGFRALVVGGGVAANSGLRSGLKGLAQTEGVALHLVPPALCTDNAAMIAALGGAYLGQGRQASLGLNAWAEFPVDRLGEALLAHPGSTVPMHSSRSVSSPVAHQT